ncbi:nuclear transport factor 2 family protein [Aromatoleum anaerobium]|uniref:Steroid delta-isomerase n=1 Tax=Aromatoleum anaerobium TaxID=182180 RepID=A0ABX1PKV8_9RHOO|nr:nuclear transport factor 2 family protein [Aromatoleum anaerobium]MCK0508142.1 nuclear transport factor 2 family protein [Aromatoleum anaerobium]
MRSVLERMIEGLNAGDVQKVVALYADDATIEDPVGGGMVVRGRDAITAFYDKAVAMRAHIELVAPIRASHGNAAAMAFDVLADTPDGGIRIAVIEVIELDDALKIRAMRAYWAPDDVSPAAGNAPH